MGTCLGAMLSTSNRRSWEPGCWQRKRVEELGDMTVNVEELISLQGGVTPICVLIAALVLANREDTYAVIILGLLYWVFLGLWYYSADQKRKTLFNILYVIEWVTAVLGGLLTIGLIAYAITEDDSETSTGGLVVSMFASAIATAIIAYTLHHATKLRTALIEHHRQLFRRAMWGTDYSYDDEYGSDYDTDALTN